MNNNQNNQNEKLNKGGDIVDRKNSNKKNREELIKIAKFLYGVGIILMIVGAVIMFARLSVAEFDTISNEYLASKVEIVRSGTLGVFSLGFISYLSAKCIVDLERL